MFGGPFPKCRSPHHDTQVAGYKGTEATISCTGSRLHVVWSPPGTGKTARLAKVVRTLVDGGERVLVLAYANAAVDMALLRGADAFLESAKLSGGKVLRLGVPQLPEVRLRRETLPETIIERTKL